MGSWLDVAGSLLGSLSGVLRQQVTDPLTSLASTFTQRASGPDPLSNLWGLGAGSSGGPDPLNALLSRRPSAGADPLSNLASLFTNTPKAAPQSDQIKAAVAAATHPVPANGAPFAAPQQAMARQIMGQAATQFGPAAAPVIGAVLQAENGLGGAVGDQDISPVGSHGPFQFYGPGGQLDEYAKAYGVDLATAGQMARTDPFGAAQWALNSYLGPALQQGIAQGHTGEALLRDVLAVQNSGALQSPAHWARYQQALQQQTAPPVALAPTAAGTPQAFLAQLDSYVGVPYALGGTTRGGLDCSGLIVAAMRDLGTPLPAGVRTAQQIHNVSQPVAPEAVQPGDLVFFTGTDAGNPGERDTHVGVVTQHGVMINAPEPGRAVGYANLNTPYWQTKVTGYGRLAGQ